MMRMFHLVQPAVMIFSAVAWIATSPRPVLAQDHAIGYAERVALGIDEGLDKARLLNAVATAHLRAGRDDEAAALCETVLALIDTMELATYTKAELAADIAGVYVQMGQLSRATEALSHIDTSSHAAQVAPGLLAIALKHEELGDSAMAAEVASEALRMAHINNSTTPNFGVAMALLKLADTYVEAGHQDRAVELLDEALQKAQQIDLSVPMYRSTALARLAAAYARAGDVSRARELASMPEFLSDQAQGLIGIASAHARRGEKAEAAVALRQAMETAGRDTAFYPDLYADMALNWIEIDSTEAAQDLLDAAPPRSTEARNLTRYAWLYAAAGNHSAAMAMAGRIGDPSAAALAYAAVAYCHAEAQRLELADEALAQACGMAAALEDAAARSAALLSICQVHSAAGRCREALAQVDSIPLPLSRARGLIEAASCVDQTQQAGADLDELFQTVVDNTDFSAGPKAKPEAAPRFVESWTSARGAPALRERWRFAVTSDDQAQLFGELYEDWKIGRAEPAFHGDYVFALSKGRNENDWWDKRDWWYIHALDRSTGATLWSNSLPETRAIQFPMYGPVVDGAQVFVVSTDGAGESPKLRLAAYSLPTGEMTWVAKLDAIRGNGCRFDLAATDSQVFLVNADSESWIVYCCDRKSGKKKWDESGSWGKRFSLVARTIQGAVAIHDVSRHVVFSMGGGFVALSPGKGDVVVAGPSCKRVDTAVLCADRGAIRACDSATLEQLWEVEAGVRAKSWEAVRGDDGVTWFLANGRHLVGLSADGKILARVDLEKDSGIGKVQRPQMCGGRFYGVSDGGKVLCSVDPGNPSDMWRWMNDGDDPQNLAIAELGSPWIPVRWKQGIAVVDHFTGELLWKRETPAGLRITMPRPGSTGRFVLCAASATLGLRVRDGSAAWALRGAGMQIIRFFDRQEENPIAVCQSEDELRAVGLERSTGEVLWTLPLESAPAGACVNGDCVYCWDARALVACPLP